MTVNLETKRIGDFLWNYGLGYGVALLIFIGILSLILTTSNGIYDSLINSPAIWGVVIGTSMGTALNLLYWYALISWGEIKLALTPALFASLNIFLFLSALVLPMFNNIVYTQALTVAVAVLVAAAVGLLYLAVYLPINMSRAFYELE